jgi:hypothetical protein
MQLHMDLVDLIQQRLQQATARLVSIQADSDLPISHQVVGISHVIEQLQMVRDDFAALVPPNAHNPGNLLNERSGLVSGLHL